MNESFNEGMYADRKIADEWVDWTKGFRADDTRNLDIYPYISEWLNKYRPKKILEIGSGSGLCLKSLVIDPAIYTGIEPSQHLRQIARIEHQAYTFLPGKAEALPVPDVSVDAAISVFVWLHIKDLDRAASELARVLMSKGRFIIVTANPASYDVWKSWHKNIRMNGFELIGDLKHLSGHQMFLYSEDQLKNSLTGKDLVIDDVKYFGRTNTLTDNPDIKYSIVLAGHKG